MMGGPPGDMDEDEDEEPDTDGEVSTCQCMHLNRHGVRTHCLHICIACTAFRYLLVINKRSVFRLVLIEMSAPRAAG